MLESEIVDRVWCVETNKNVILFDTLESATKWIKLTCYYNSDIDDEVCEYDYLSLSRKDVVKYNEVHKK